MTDKYDEKMTDKYDENMTDKYYVSFESSASSLPAVHYSASDSIEVLASSPILHPTTTTANHPPESIEIVASSPSNLHSTRFDTNPSFHNDNSNAAASSFPVSFEIYPTVSRLAFLSEQQQSSTESRDIAMSSMNLPSNIIDNISRSSSSSDDIMINNTNSFIHDNPTPSSGSIIVPPSTSQSSLKIIPNIDLSSHHGMFFSKSFPKLHSDTPLLLPHYALYPPYDNNDNDNKSPIKTNKGGLLSKIAYCCCCSHLYNNLLGSATTIISLWALTATAGGSYLLSEYLHLVSLYSKVDELLLEVDRLNDANEQYERLNSQLQDNNDEYKELNLMLRSENHNYHILNDQLNQTQTTLRRINDNLNATVDDLTATTEELYLVNDNMTQTLQAIQSQNDDYRELNRQQQNVLDFLNATVTEIDDDRAASYEQIVSFLDSQITIFRNVVVENLRLAYGMTVDGWRCDVRDAFAADDFINEPQEPMGRENYENVMSYLEEQVFERVCLNVTDFVSYLERKVKLTSAAKGGSSSSEMNGTTTTSGADDDDDDDDDGYYLEDYLTLAQLTSGVKMYFGYAQDYYFPPSHNGYSSNRYRHSADAPLTAQEWMDAGYRCEGLSKNRTFVYHGNGSSSSSTTTYGSSSIVVLSVCVSFFLVFLFGVCTTRGRSRSRSRRRILRVLGACH